MNVPSASHAESSAAAAPRPILVWDAPVRVFHWLIVLCFAGAYLTAESESWRLVHVSLGYTMAGLVAFRILWGLLGTRYARFASFVRGPKAVAGYVGAMVRGRPVHHTGHNPAGAMAIVALLSLALAVTAFGWATYNEWGGEWLEEAHELVANLMLGVIAVHIAGVFLASWRQRENLVASMITGRKTGRPGEAIRSAWRSVAVLMLLAVAGFWWLQWKGAPTAAMLSGPVAASVQARPADQDDD